MKRVAWIALATLSACSGPTYRVRLDDGAGLRQGATVEVSGVAVGEVKEVRLVEGEVEIAFAVERGHDLQLHPDACAVVVVGADAAHLDVSLGEQPGDLGEAPIPRCPLPTEELGQLGEALGEGLRRLFDGMGDGMGQATQGLLQDMGQAMAQAQGSGGAGGNLPPFAPGTSGGPSCEGLSVSIAGSEVVAGAKKVTLVFDNQNDHGLRLPAIGNVLFLNPSTTPMVSQNILGETWFMPIDIPARGQVTVTVALGSESELDGIEVRQITRQDQPLSSCTLAQSGL